MDKEGFKLDVGSNSFDYMRIICACTVFLGHFLTHFQCHNDVLNFIAYFVRGVPVFFCLSGFFCVKSLQEYGCRKFIKKRFLKLYPPLWVCIILNTILIMFTYQTKPTAKEFFIYITTQFSIFQFYTGDWLRGYGVGAPNGALWTVSTELQFYFLLVLLFPFVKKWSLKLWGIVIGILGGFSLVLGQAEEVLPSIVNKILMVSVFPFLYIFLFGVMCYLHREKLMPIYQKVCVPLCIIYVIWNILPDKITSEIGGVRYNVVTTILLMPIVMSLGYKFKKHRVRNELSYHFYLYHMVVINFFVQNFERPDSKISMALYFVSTFGITILFAIFSQKVVDGVISKRIRSKLFLRGENKKWLHRR